jgi:hypothetical protein
MLTRRFERIGSLLCCIDQPLRALDCRIECGLQPSKVLLAENADLIRAVLDLRRQVLHPLQLPLDGI